VHCALLFITPEVKLFSTLHVHACDAWYCRDRAEERRKGINPDYARVNADLASIVTGNAQLERDITQISVEDSKFLGGDVEHTHLVKGLDYALLQKVCHWCLAYCLCLGLSAHLHQPNKSIYNRYVGLNCMHLLADTWRDV
jgi:hypothetical protein